MKNDFDLIAPVYDALAKLIFGDALLASQRWLIAEIKEDTEVLVIGGGTGLAFEGIRETFSITYLEKSQKMLHLSRQRLVQFNTQFVHADFFEWETNLKYDCIMLPYFLDCFEENQLNQVIQKCRNLLRDKGKLLVAEFDKKKTNSVLSKIMHLFFRLFSNLESNSLKDIHQNILKNGYLLEKEAFFRRGTVFSRVYL